MVRTGGGRITGVLTLATPSTLMRCVSLGVGCVLGLVPSVLDVDADGRLTTKPDGGLVSDAAEVRRGGKKYDDMPVGGDLCERKSRGEVVSDWVRVGDVWLSGGNAAGDRADCAENGSEVEVEKEDWRRRSSSAAFSFVLSAISIKPPTEGSFV